MKRFTKLAVCFLLCISMLTLPVLGKELVAVGQVVGLQLHDGTVRVAAIDEALGAAARAAGVEVGDRIISIDGKTVRTARDVRDALDASRGSVQLLLQRGQRQISCQVEPSITEEGPKLGLYLRQGISGVGTVTWYDPQTGRFGALGHGVNADSGRLLKLTQGAAFRAQVVAVRKGRSGEPGQLMGCTDDADPIGVLYANMPQGVFGTAQQGFTGQTLEVAQWSQVKTGSAVILATVGPEGVKQYSVEILKLYPQANETGRNLLLRITDPALLETTGGIVQGMSGSPIIQDGKLVGAVTHVLVNDPTRGYGIFIENMLDAAA